VNCPTSSCSLQTYASGTCGTYSGRIRIPVNSSPWTINADKNVNLGYTESMCISCTNGIQTIIYPNYAVSQTENPCRSSITN